MKKTMKTSLLAQQKFAAKRTDIIDLLNPELLAQVAHKPSFRAGELKQETAPLANEAVNKVSAEPLLLAQADLVVSDAGTQTWMHASADTSASANYSPAYLAEESEARASSSFFSGSSYLMYGLAAVGVGAVIAVATKSKSKTSTETVTVTGTAAELATGGTKNASIVAGANVIVTDAATIAQLTQIDAKNGLGTLSYSAITDTVTNLSASGYVSAGKNVTITDTASLAQLKTIDDTTGSGTLTFTKISDTAANLASNFDGYLTSGLTVTSTVATLAELASIKAVIGSSTLTYSISDTSTNVLSEKQASPSTTAFSGATSVNIAMDSNPATIADVNTLKSVKSGTNVTGYSISDTSTNLLDPNNSTILSGATATGGTGSFAISMTDSPSTLTITNLNTLLGLKTGSVDLTIGYGISDTATNLITALAANANLLSGASLGVVVNDTPALSISNVGLLSSAGVTFANGYSISDSAANLITALGSSATAAQSTALSGATGVAFSIIPDLSVAEAESLSNIMTLNPNTYSISDTSFYLLTASPSLLSDATGITITDTPALNLEQAVAIKSANTKSVGGSYTLNDSSFIILDGLTANAAIISGANSVTLSDAPTLTLADAILLKAANTSITPYSISGTGAEMVVAAGTVAGLNALNAASTLQVTDTPTLTVADAAKLNALSPSYISGYTLQDSAANFNNLVGYKLSAVTSVNQMGITVSDANAPVLSANSATLLLGKSAAFTAGAYSLSDKATLIMIAIRDVSQLTVRPAVSIITTDAESSPANLTVQNIATLQSVTSNLTLGAHNVSNVSAADLDSGSTVLPMLVNAKTLDATGASLTLNVTEMQNFLTGSSNLVSGDSIIINDAILADLGVLRSYGGNGILTLGGDNNGAVRVDLGSSGVTTVNLNGTGLHSVQGSNAQAETFVLNDATNNFSSNVGINGGTGVGDVLRLTSSHSSLVLSDYIGTDVLPTPNFNSAGTPTINGIEKIDLRTDPTANSVKLSAADLFSLNSDLKDSLNNAVSTLVIDGTSADTVTLNPYDKTDNLNNLGVFTLQGNANTFTATGATGAGYSKYTATYFNNGSDQLVEVLLQNGIVVA